MRRALNRFPPLLLFAVLWVLAQTTAAAAAPGDTVTVVNGANESVTGVEVDTDGDGATDGIDTTGDGQPDVVDADGNGVSDDIQPGGAPGDCGFIDVGCQVGEVVSNVAGDILQTLAESIVEGIGNITASLGTMWVQIGTPSLASGSVAEWLRGQLAFYVGMLALIATFIGAAKTAIEHRAQPAKELAQALIRLTIVNAVSVSLIAALVAAGDAFAIYIIDQSTGGNFAESMTRMLALASISGLGVIVVILLGICALFSSLAQLVLMIARGGLLLVMTGVLPLAASFTNTAAGRSWYQKAVAWTVAAILYKPAAAIIYAVAFRAVGATQDGLVTVLTGLMLMLMALFALPALMRLAVPLVASVASSGGGGGGGSTAVVAGMVATGAQVVTMRSNGSGGGAGYGAPPPPPYPGPTGSGTPGGGVPGPRGPSGSSMPGGSGGAGTPGPSGAGSPGGAGAAGAAGPAGAAAAAGAQAAQGAVTAVQNTTNRAADPGGASQ